MKLANKITCLMLLSSTACLDLQDAQILAKKESAETFSPMILARHVSPNQKQLFKPMPLGEKCSALEFKIPFEDLAFSNRFYFGWWFDDILLEEGIIDPETRGRSVIFLKLDRAKIEHIMKGPLTEQFFNSFHLMEFFVADRKYLIPENGVSETGAHETGVRWTIRYVDQAC